MVFLLTGGQQAAPNPTYKLSLRATSQTHDAITVPVASATRPGLQPTSANATVTAYYTLTDATGSVIVGSSRSISAAYDVPTQQFAALRAKQDAENRAARELARVIYLHVAGELGKGSS